MNNELIQEVETFKDEVLEKLSHSDIVKFQLGDVDFDSSVKINDAIITDKAIGKILSSIRVKNNFLNYKEEIDEAKWQLIKNALKDVNSNLEFYGKKRIDDAGNYYIDSLYPKNNAFINTDAAIYYQEYFDMILDALKNTHLDLILKEKTFQYNDDSVILRFIDDGNIIDPFGHLSSHSVDNKSDLWKRGCDLSFNIIEYNSAPFIERLICTNGMVAAQHGFKTNIRNKSFTNEYIEKNLNSMLVKGDEKYDSMLVNAVNHMRNSDLSINEFYSYRNFFDGKNENGKYNHILSKVLNDDILFAQYGINVKEKSDKWQRTANSGRNVYDFVNDMSWLPAHPEQSRMEEDDCRELQIKLSDLFFKERYDLEDVAPKINFNVDKKIQVNN